MSPVVILGSISAEIYGRKRLEINNKNAEENQYWLNNFRKLFLEEFSAEEEIKALFDTEFSRWEKGRFKRFFKNAPIDVLNRIKEHFHSDEIIARFEKVLKKYKFEIMKSEIKVLYMQKLENSKS